MKNNWGVEENRKGRGRGAPGWLSRLALGFGSGHYHRAWDGGLCLATRLAWSLLKSLSPSAPHVLSLSLANKKKKKKRKVREERKSESWGFTVQFEVVCVAEKEPILNSLMLHPQSPHVNGLLLACWFWGNLMEKAEFHIHSTCAEA